MIWRRQSHVTVKHLLSDLTDIRIVHLLSITLPLPCPLALSSWEETIWRTCHRQALALRSNAVSTRFEQLGRMDDLEEAITCQRQALVLRPHGHLDHSTTLPVPCAFILGSWQEWRIWRRRRMSPSSAWSSPLRTSGSFNVSQQPCRCLVHSLWAVGKNGGFGGGSVKRLRSSLTDIPIVHLLSTTLPMMCSLALSI